MYVRCLRTAVAPVAQSLPTRGDAAHARGTTTAVSRAGHERLGRSGSRLGLYLSTERAGCYRVLLSTNGTNYKVRGYCVCSQEAREPLSEEEKLVTADDSTRASRSPAGACSSMLSSVCA